MQRMHAVVVVVLIVVGGLALSACGGGGGDGGVDISGWWRVATRNAATTDPFETTSLSPIAQTNGTAWIGGTEVARTGRDYFGADPNPMDPNRGEIALRAESADFITGTVTLYSGGTPNLIADVQLSRDVAPMGTFSMNGSVAAQPVAVNTANGYAQTDEGAATYDIEIIHSDPFTGDTELDLFFNFAPSLLIPGTYNDPANVQASVDVEPTDTFDTASSGSVTFSATNTTGSRLAGSYNFTLSGGGSVTGTFDVPIVIVTTN